MKKAVILLAVISICLACCGVAKDNAQTQTETQTETQTQTQTQTEKPDTIIPEKERVSLTLTPEDSIYYEDSKYIVVGRERDDYVGTDFTVLNKKKNTIKKYTKDNIKGGLQFFYAGVIKDYFIIDDGTSNVRTLIIVDMSSEKIINKDIVYVNEIEVTDEEIYFWTPIEELPDNVTPPECDKMEGIPDSQYGFIEKCTFNFDKLEIEHLGEFECQYFE